LTNTTDNYEIECASGIDIGRVRHVNQDRCDCFETSNPGSHILIVADGMGGHAGGEVAAEIAIESVKKINKTPFSDPRKHLIKSFELAAKQLIKRADSDENLHNMGCTLSLILYHKKQVFAGHIGDSRIYKISNGTIHQLSEDHSLVREMVKQGAVKPENARTHPNSNILLKALTINSQSDYDIYEPVKVLPKDVLLVCSDGLWNMVEDKEIMNIAIDNTAEKAVKLLIDRANELGGKDNIAVSIMRII